MRHSGKHQASEPAKPSPATQAASKGRLQRLGRIDAGLVAVGLLILIAISPLFQRGLPDIADAPIHLFRTAEWVRSWQAGIPLPRWSPHLAYGFGYPLFVFVPPLPYALAGSLHLLGLDLTTAIKLLSMGCFALAGFGMYALAGEYLNRGGAVAASAAYLFAPFLLREAYLYGGNYPQLLAIALFPAVLWAFHRLMETPGPSHLLLASGLYGALILSHNFHSLLFTPLLILYIILSAGVGSERGSRSESRPSRRAQPVASYVRRVLAAGLAVVLGLGWTAFFWLPALVERQWTRAQAEFYIAASPYFRRFLDWRDLIAQSEPLDAAAANPSLPFTLGLVIVVLAILGIVAAAARRKTRGVALLFGVSLLLAVLMMLPESEWVWRNVPLLAVAEFPWRLMGVAALFAAFFAGAATTLWPRTGFSGAAPTIAVLAIVLGSAVYLYPPRSFVTYGAEGTPSLADQVGYELATGTLGSTTLGEYLPLWVEQVPQELPLVPELQSGRSGEKLDRLTLPPSVEATLVTHTPRSDVYSTESDQAFTARFHTFYFPGWSATIDGEPVDMEISEPHGLIEVGVPAGEHLLSVALNDTPLRSSALLVSAASLACALAVAIVWSYKGQAIRSRSAEALRRADIHMAALLLALLVLFVGKVAFVDQRTSWFRLESPPNMVKGVSRPLSVNLENTVLLLGYDLDSNVVRAGDKARLTLFWQALEPIKADYAVFVHLDALPYGTTALAADNNPPGDVQAQIDIPTSHWDPGTYVRDEHRFTIPADMPPAYYSVETGFYNAKTGEGLGQAISLQGIHVLPARTMRSWQIPNRVRYGLGEHIALLGYELEGEPTPSVTLFWKTDKPLDIDYTTFVHVVSRDGALLEQRDGPPVEGRHPTSKWLPGQIIVDRREVPLPSEKSSLLVGMYDLRTMERLPAYDSDGERLAMDAIPLSTER